MSGLALLAARFALSWSVAMTPILARWIDAAKPDDLLDWRSDGPVRKGVCAMVLAAAAIAVVGPGLLHRPTIDADIPMATFERLKEELPQGRIYNYREWGGPLILTGHPGWQVAIDGRLYLYSKQEWIEYRQAAWGEIPVEELVRRHRPDAFVLHAGYHRRLVDLLEQSPHWRPWATEANCRVFLHSGHDGQPPDR
jgi:hypothetical protein